MLSARGIDVTVMATPTALWVDVDGSRVVRLEPGDTHLARQVELGALGDRVALGLDPALAAIEVERLAQGRGPWAPALQTLAFAGVSASAAVLFGGTANDAVAASALGWLASAIHGAMRTRRDWARLADGITAFGVGAAAQLLATGGVDPARVALAAIVVLAPGMALTTATAEVASGHLASGTSRLAGAVVTLVQLAAGLAVAAAVVPALPPRVETLAAPMLAIWVAHALLPVALAILGRTRPIDAPLAVLVAAGTSVVTATVPSPLGALLGATLAVALANGLAQARRVPAAVFSLPAIILLVPGSLGVNGLRTVIAGGDGSGLGWTVATAVAALAAGMLLGHALVPSGRGRGPGVDAAPARG